MMVVFPFSTYTKFWAVSMVSIVFTRSSIIFINELKQSFMQLYKIHFLNFHMLQKYHYLLL